MVVSSRSPRDRTPQETLAGRSGASLGDVRLLVGEGGGPVAAAAAVRQGVEWRAIGSGRH